MKHHFAVLSGVVLALIVFQSAESQALPARPEPYFTKDHPRAAPLATTNITPTTSPELERKRIAWEIAVYDYSIQLMEYNVTAFKWQRTAGTVVLWLGAGLVIAGILFSGYQLWSAVRLRIVPGDSALELSAQKVRVTSSVTGVVVLVISLAFVYLFVHEIYGIKVVDTPPSTTGAAENTRK